MEDPLDALEERITKLRAQVREAKAAGDHARVKLFRAQLADAERAWNAALEEAPAPPPSPPLLPLREQVHQALTLLGVPTPSRLIVSVNEAFFAGHLSSSQLTSLRRDEERSFRTTPYSRPYYLCAALTADLLAPARGLLAVSTWPLATRIVGPLSSRTDFLTAAIRIAEHIARLEAPGESAYRLLTRMAQNIPGAVDDFDQAVPARVIAAAEAELALHREADQTQRAEAAARATKQLDAVGQFFGAGLKSAARTA
ncbi:hypothetical protein N5079_32170 [Planotetraspora sp. A-T 1434]|uniref:hypothetical protein n=1 Tax=Planotetraspora sp. A-T 1434 TaxID=2979219 RepID=UPI0021BE3573|nr:hypothetical protein [Planotetraspora sp. A-T 1434]MCT9934873.1 hypothetical protein [Planotetraspora sp. A-T 1434]